MKQRRKRVHQPPIDPERRDTEARGRWTGIALGVIGVAAVMLGLGRQTSLPLPDGSRATERQIVRAFTRGGLHVARSRTQPAGPRIENTARIGQDAERSALADTPDIPDEAAALVPATNPPRPPEPSAALPPETQAAAVTIATNVDEACPT